MAQSDEILQKIAGYNTSITSTNTSIGNVEERLIGAKAERAALLLEIEKAAHEMQTGLIQSQLEDDLYGTAACGIVQTEGGDPDMPAGDPDPGASLTGLAASLAGNLFATPDDMTQFNQYVSYMGPDAADEYTALLEELSAMGGDAALLAGHVQGDADNFLTTQLQGCQDQRDVSAHIKAGDISGIQGTGVIILDTLASVKSYFSEQTSAKQQMLADWNPGSTSGFNFILGTGDELTGTSQGSGPRQGEGGML